MIRNRSQITMTSSPTGSDIENNMQSDGKGSYRTPWGTTLSRRFVYVLMGCLFLFFVEIFLLNPAPLEEHRASSAASREQLTIVMNTFKRHELMLGTFLPLTLPCKNIIFTPFNCCFFIRGNWPLFEVSYRKAHLRGME